MKKLEDGDFKEAKKEIESHYFRSINAISVDITDLSGDLQCRCCEKTVREKLRLCFDLVKYKSVKGIPFAMKNDVIVLINQWLDHAKTLKKCVRHWKHHEYLCKVNRHLTKNTLHIIKLRK